MTLIVVTPPTEEPLTTAEAKQHLVVEHSNDDTLIAAQIEAARRLAELRTNRQLVVATYDWKIDRFTDRIRLPKPPTVSVTSIKYIDTDGAEQTLDTSVYDVQPNSVPGEIRLAYQQSWPSIRMEPEPITIRFVTGYADAASVPQAIKRWMLMKVGDMYNHREETIIGSGSNTHTFTDALIRSLEVPELA
jgi:uncharacterized phiE125 gp8 family phage protein